ncbi:hypothetical protein CMK11_00110 [Candidatus Poribacteria bacterium]|jgi:hypothetical protein|nr:hypothetical protein [Candidatus Poribacteria bacterium]
MADMAITRCELEDDPTGAAEARPIPRRDIEAAILTALDDEFPFHCEAGQAHPCNTRGPR